MSPAPVIVWLRRDLRLVDNPALFHAAATGAAVLPVYIHAPEEEGGWTTGAAGRWWLHHSLAALAGALEECGAGLVLRGGGSLETLLALARGSGARAVYWNRALEPVLDGRDSRVRHALQGEGIEVREYPAGRLFEPAAVRTREGAPFRVFTPFWKAALAIGPDLEPLPAPPVLPPLPGNPATLPLEALALRPGIAWDSGLRAAWRPGEAGARERLQETLATVAPAYAGLRDRPDVNGTSRLSPHLHFGEVSPRQVAAALEMLR
ncbi:MAG: deoxyribodipyrimidine photo-lyase, partial [Gammaproteobacteria bacterium]|nr:deoxyribodipyrimidine photo-lyase [Gammaproteobacteria bacterium]